MERHRSMFHTKIQNKAPEKELNKTETSNLPDTEFKTLVLTMLNKLRGRIDEIVRTLTKRFKT